MTTSSPTPPAEVRALLDDRYGRTRRPGKRRVAIVALILAAAAVIAFGWMTVATAAEQVDARTTGFRIIDEHAVEVEFQITPPAGREVACFLEAQDTEHGIVGWRMVRIPASADHTRSFVETVPTLSEATTGLVNSCRVT